MPNLLLQSCSASKNEVDSPTPAFDLYSGYFYRILDKCVRDGEFRPDTDVKILSAKYGVLDPSEPIEYYDRRMDSARAEELNPAVVETLAGHVERTGYDRIVVNMGAAYREAIAGLSDRVDATFAEITGDGIGEKGHALYRFIRGDDSVVTVVDDV